MLEQAIEQYLKSLHCELWPAETFYISQEDGRDKAVEWIAKLVREVEH